MEILNCTTFTKFRTQLHDLKVLRLNCTSDTNFGTSGAFIQNNIFYNISRQALSFHYLGHIKINLLNFQLQNSELSNEHIKLNTIKV